MSDFSGIDGSINGCYKFYCICCAIKTTSFLFEDKIKHFRKLMMNNYLTAVIMINIITSSKK
jgi:hypothetical protein